MLKSELIKENKNLLIQNGQLMYLLEFGELRFEDSNHQMIWKHDSSARILQERIEKAIEYIGKYAEVYEANPILDNFSIHASPKELINILKGEKE